MDRAVSGVTDCGSTVGQPAIVLVKLCCFWDRLTGEFNGHPIHGRLGGCVLPATRPSTKGRGARAASDAIFL